MLRGACSGLPQHTSENERHQKASEVCDLRVMKVQIEGFSFMCPASNRAASELADIIMYNIVWYSIV